MNASEKQIVERAIKQARPADVSVEAISSVGGSDGVRRALRSIEVDAAKHQKAGGELLLIAIRR